MPQSDRERNHVQVGGGDGYKVTKYVSM